MRNPQLRFTHHKGEYEKLKYQLKKMVMILGDWLASFYDHLLFRDTIHIIHEMTGGKLFHEYFEGEISNIHNVLTDSYITEHVDGEYDTLRILLKDGQRYEIFCPYRTFIIGDRISEQLLAIKDLKEFSRTIASNDSDQSVSGYPCQ